MSEFLITRNKGFRITFENGFAISVQWGPENYCERKDHTDFNQPMKERFVWSEYELEKGIYSFWKNKK